MIAFSVVWFIVVLPHSVRCNWTENHPVLCSCQITQLQSALDGECNNLYHILEPIFGRLFQKNILGLSLRSCFWFIHLFKKRCNTSQGFGAFFLQSCDRLLFFFFFFSFFFVFFFVFLVNIFFFFNLSLSSY